MDALFVARAHERARHVHIQQNQRLNQHQIDFFDLFVWLVGVNLPHPLNVAFIVALKKVSSTTTTTATTTTTISKQTCNMCVLCGCVYLPKCNNLFLCTDLLRLISIQYTSVLREFYRMVVEQFHGLRKKIFFFILYICL